MTPSRTLVRLVAWIVPRQERRAWRSEWLAELAVLERGGSRPPSPSRFRFALGCVPDALSMRVSALSPAALLTDLRHAARGLGRAPGFTAASVGTLALGMAVATVLFSMINGIVLRPPLGVQDADRIVQVGRSSETAPSWEAFSSRAFEQLSTETRTLTGVAGWSVHAFALGEPGEARYVPAHLVTGGYFETLGTRAQVGRLIEASDDVAPGDHPVAVLSHDLWVSAYGADPGVVGRTVMLDGAPFTVIGVTPKGFHGLHTVGTKPELFVPSMMNPGYQGSLPFGSWRWQWLNAFGRLHPTASLEDVRSELSQLSTRLRLMDDDQAGTVLRASAGAGLAPWDRDRALRLIRMAGIVCALLFLLTVTAVGNLLLARGLTRRAELGVRMTLGAGPDRVARGLGFESLLIALGAFAIATPLAMLLDDLLPALVPLPVIGSMAVGGDVLRVLFAASLITAVLMAWGPMRITRSVGPAAGLHRRDGGLPRESWIRDALVGSQVVLSMALVSGAVLLGRSMLNVWTAEPGYDPRGVYATSIEVSRERENARDRAGVYLASLLDDLESRDEVRTAAVATQLPIAGGQNRGSFAPADRPDDRFEGEVVGVAGSYFEVLGMPILRGRAFAGPDAQSARTAVVSASVAELFWPGEDPIGQELAGDPVWRVVGVVPDASLRSLRADPVPTVYFPIPLTLESDLEVLLEVEPGTAVPAELVADAVRRLGGPGAATGSVDLYGAMVASMGETRVMGVLLGSFALLSILLSVLGQYGLGSYIARRRTREFGVRLTLGASPAELRSIVLRRGLKLTAVGVGIGLVVALATGRLLAAALYEIPATDPVTLLAAGGLLALTSLAAVWLPARRAARVDPVVSMRDS